MDTDWTVYMQTETRQDYSLVCDHSGTYDSAIAAARERISVGRMQCLVAVAAGKDPPDLSPRANPGIRLRMLIGGPDTRFRPGGRWKGRLYQS